MSRPRSFLQLALAAALGFLGALLLVTATAPAMPPPNADPALAPWFQSLVIPGSDMSCCSQSDGRPTEIRPYAGKDPGIILEALVIKDANHWPAADATHWVEVPATAVIRTANPTGQPILFWTPGTGVLCFVFASGA